MSSLGPDQAVSVRATLPTPSVPTSSWLPAFFIVAVIWGASFMFIKVALDELAPVYIALYRVALGGLTLLGYSALRGLPLPRGGQLWLHLFAFGFIATTVPFTLFGYAEERVSSVLAGIWNGTVPLTALVVTLIVLQLGRARRGRGDTSSAAIERPSGTQIGGLLLGFVGVLVVLGVWDGVGGASLTGQLILLAAVTCYGIGMNYSRWIMKRFDISALQLTVAQLVTSTLQLLIIAPLVAGAPPAPGSHSWKVTGSVIALGVLGTGLALALNFHVIRTVGVTIGSTVTYLPPLVAAVAGVTLLDEHLTWNQPVGGLIVLAAVGVSQGLLTRRWKQGPPVNASRGKGAPS